MFEEWKAAFLRHTPTTDLMMEAGKNALGPAAGAALVVFALLLLVLGKRASLFAGSLAMLAGFAVSNYFRMVFPWWPNDRVDLSTEPASLMSPPAWQWLPLLFLVAQFDGLFARTPSVPLWGGWRLRLGLGLIAALVLIPPGFHSKLPELYSSWPFPLQAKVWPLLLFTLAVALGWAGSETVAKNNPGPMVAFGLAFSLFGASLVIAHAHSALFADALSIPAAALMAVGIVSIFCRVDVSGALPGIAVILPSILLSAYLRTESQVPWKAFVFAGCSPVAIGLMAIPPLSRLSGFGKWALFTVLCLGPTIAAVTFAVKAETLLVEEDGW